jgi:hypothetical protein
VNEIPFWQVAVNTTHEIDNSVTEENSIKLSLHISEGLMNLGRNLNWVNEIAFVRVNSFILFISGWNFAKSLNLCWEVAVISAEKSDLVGLGVLQQSIDDCLADGAGCTSNQNVETVVVPAEIHVVKMRVACASNWTLRLWLILNLNTNGICYDSTKEIHEATLFRCWCLLLIRLHFCFNYNFLLYPRL